jgi:energy-coupling factor transporter ATP-binding protein EcfA2
MPDVYQGIRSWLHGRPDWQQQAAEMLLASGTVSDADIQTLAERLKTPEGRQATTARAFSTLAPTTASNVELHLVEIGEVSGIENLSPRTPLAFGDGKLSVIYGHNGSGKSGYTRLLKKICGKPRASELKSNVFQAPPAVRKCRISYRAGGQLQQVEWPANGAPIDELRSVDIFDTDIADFYLTEETSVAYVPPAVALFEALARVCDRIKEHLVREQSALASSLPALPSEYSVTAAGKIYRSLGPQTSDVEVEQLTRWSAEDQHNVAAISERLNVADPSALARNKRGQKSQIDELAVLLRSSASAYSEVGLSAIRAARADAQTKRQIATEAAQVNSAELQDVGSPTWRAMWRAARDYSQRAYPGRDYPASEDGDRCLLCHQVLDAQARARLGEFEAFVQGALEAEASTAENRYRELLTALPSALTPDQITRRCQAAALQEESWVRELGEFWGRVVESRRAMLADEAEASASPVPLPERILAVLEQRAHTLEREAAQHELDARGFDRSQSTKNKLELEARRWMSQQSDAIRSEVARQRRLAQYEEWKRLADSRGISRNAGSFAERIITKAFVERFNRELAAFGASRIKVEVFKTRTDHGRVLHRLQLKDSRSGDVGPETVLSEGERRIVALAAFLADVADQPNAAPFVFDDPISSLDHDFEWHVASRLATLAQTRQVVVLTHRLSLYGAMEDAAKRLGEKWKDKHLQQRCIESFGGRAGQPADKAVGNAGTAEANLLLLKQVDAAEAAGLAGGAAQYRALAQSICSEFRKLLERTVEHDLLNKVVLRHRRSVTTDGRIGSLARISSYDCDYFDDLMTKYSCFEHSQSDETPTFLPEAAELRADLQSLKTWREDFKKRPTEPAK